MGADGCGFLWPVGHAVILSSIAVSNCKVCVVSVCVGAWSGVGMGRGVGAWETEVSHSDFLPLSFLPCLLKHEASPWSSCLELALKQWLHMCFRLSWSPAILHSPF